MNRRLVLAAAAVVGVLLVSPGSAGSVTPCEPAAIHAASLEVFLDRNAPVDGKQRRHERTERAFIAQVRTGCGVT